MDPNARELGQVAANPRPREAGVQPATQAEMETATASGVYVSPSVMVHSPGVAKAWCHFLASGGTPTLATGTGKVHNVTSIGDNGVGDFTFTLTAKMSSTQWVAGANGRISSGAGVIVANLASGATPMASGSVRMKFQNENGGTGAAMDPGIGVFWAFGDRS